MAAMKATVFGAQGFVGRHLVAHLRERGFAVYSVVRDDTSWRGEDLGHVFYCFGLTADFRSRPFETIDAHVSVLIDVLRGARFEALVYLSSTRVYARSRSTDEAAPLPVVPGDPDDLYNLSKLMGEAACLGSGVANARIARLSNVFGDDTTSRNFLTSVVRAAAEQGHIQLATALDSEKDYIWIGDAVAALEAIATRGPEPITNVAFGANTTHREIMTALCEVTGCSVHVAPQARAVRFARIATERMDRLIARPKTPLTSMMGDLAAMFAAECQAHSRSDGTPHHRAGPA